MNTARQIDELKSKGRYFEAGKLARELGRDCYFGCHFGLRSERDRAVEEFTAGYNAEDTVQVWPRGYAHETGTVSFKIAAGASEAAIAGEVRRRFGPYASVCGVTRALSPRDLVSDADARRYSRHDNS